MGKLIATAHILYLSKQYKPGQELPQNNQGNGKSVGRSRYC